MIKSNRLTLSPKDFLLLLGFAFGALTITSCQTMEGVGEDMQHAGQHIEEAAE